MEGWGVALAASLVGWASAYAQPPAAPSAVETIEASDLAKFAPFVSWPASAYPSDDAPLVICVQGVDPFGVTLDRMIAGRRLGPHPLIVRRIEALSADSGCHIAYVGGSPAQPAAAALKAVAQAPVLTVTDEQSRGGGKGIVQLFLSNGRVRFAIDSDQAAKAGLTISSKLLALAQEPIS